MSRTNAFYEGGCLRCERMHRRAQDAEAAAAKVLRQNSHEQLWKTVDYLRRWRERDREKLVRYAWRMRAYADALRARGVDNREIIRLTDAADMARKQASWRGFEPLPRQGDGTEG